MFNLLVFFFFVENRLILDTSTINQDGESGLDLANIALIITILILVSLFKIVAIIYCVTKKITKELRPLRSEAIINTKSNKNLETRRGKNTTLNNFFQNIYN